MLTLLGILLLKLGDFMVNLFESNLFFSFSVDPGLLGLSEFSLQEVFENSDNALCHHLVVSLGSIETVVLGLVLSVSTWLASTFHISSLIDNLCFLGTKLDSYTI